MTFKGLIRDVRDVQAPEGSINAQLLALPQQREHTHDMQGRVLLFPRTGIIGVPFQMHKDSWSVVIVDGSAARKENGMESYPRGGYHIDVSNLEMQTAIELEFTEGWGVKVGNWEVPADTERECAEVVRMNRQDRPDRPIAIIREVRLEARMECKR